MGFRKKKKLICLFSLSKISRICTCILFHVIAYILVVFSEQIIIIFNIIVPLYCIMKKMSILRDRQI